MHLEKLHDHLRPSRGIREIMLLYMTQFLASCKTTSPKSSVSRARVLMRKSRHTQSIIESMRSVEASQTTSSCALLICTSSWSRLKTSMLVRDKSHH